MTSSWMRMIAAFLILASPIAPAAYADLNPTKQVAFCDPDTYALPQIEYDSEAEEWYVVLEGGIRATFDLDEPGLVRLSHPDWEEEFFLRLQLAAPPGSADVVFAASVEDLSGSTFSRYVASLHKDLQNEDQMQLAVMNFPRAEDSTSYLVNANVPFSLDRFTIVGEEEAELYGGSNDGGDGRGVVIDALLKPGPAVVAALLITAVVLLLTNGHYSCANWFMEFINGCD